MIDVDKTHVLVIFLLASLILSGCITQQDSSKEKKFPEDRKTVSIRSITLSRSRLRPGQKVKLEVIVTNNNDYAAEQVDVTLSNIDPLENVGSALTGNGAGTCSLGSMNERVNNLRGPTRSCSWTLKCGNKCSNLISGYNEPIDVSPNLELSYRTRLHNMQNAISMEFKNYEEMRSGEKMQKNYVVSNGDLQLNVKYETPQGIDSSRRRQVSMDMELRDKGTKNDGLVSSFDLRYRNSLSDHITNQPCQTLVVPEERDSVSEECFLQLGTLGFGTIYKLGISGTYKYRKQKEIRMEIVPNR